MCIPVCRASRPAWQIAAVITLAAANPALGQVVFSTIPSGVTSPTGSTHLYQFSNGGGFNGIRLGQRFTPQISGGITQISAWAYAGAVSQSARFEVYNDVAGLPGTLLGSLLVQLPIAGSGLAPTIPTPAFALDGSILLTANQPYYCALGPVGTTTISWWCPTVLPPGTESTQCYRDNTSAPWAVTANATFPPGLAITIPAPASGPMVLVAWAATMRRRRATCQPV